MKSRKLLALAVGTLGLGTAALAYIQPAERHAAPVVPATPLVDKDGRAAPGNVISKGQPRPKPDGGFNNEV